MLFATKNLLVSFYPFLSLLKPTVNRYIQNPRHPSITCAVGYVRGSPRRVEITPSNMNCQELFLYRSGVYSVSGGGVLVGQQAVRLLGWGQQDGERFWRVANTWGRDWGEEGTFRIRRGEGRQD